MFDFFQISHTLRRRVRPCQLQHSFAEQKRAKCSTVTVRSQSEEENTVAAQQTTKFIKQQATTMQLYNQHVNFDF